MATSVSEIVLPDAFSLVSSANIPVIAVVVVVVVGGGGSGVASHHCDLGSILGSYVGCDWLISV